LSRKWPFSTFFVSFFFFLSTFYENICSRHFFFVSLRPILYFGLLWQYG